jgi:hypothetical protein
LFVPGARGVPENSTPVLNSLATSLPEFAILRPIAVPRQRRGKSLTRRKYQQGHVFQKGRKKSDKWLADAPAYVQFWRDIPGQQAPKRDVVAIGICRTKTIAERKAAERLEQLGINAAQTFIESTCSTTFKEQGEMWLKSLANRKRNPLEPSTIDARRYYLDKWIYPFFEGRLLAEINNRAMKDLVEHLAAKLQPSTIRELESREGRCGERDQRRRRRTFSAKME